MAKTNRVTLDEARRDLSQRLVNAGIESAVVDAKTLLGLATGLDPSQLISKGTDLIESKAYEALWGYAARRLNGEPISQILGYRDFWKDRFAVTSDVLTPRPETEGIISAALELCDVPQRILDLGTGSGAIILSLLREFETARGLAVDISYSALAVAKDNALSLGLNTRCDFIQSDWFENVTGAFDLIVSNPPYITSAEMDALSKDVAEFEPHLALHGGDDGLAPYRILAEQAGAYLKPSGKLIVEIGYLQGPGVSGLFESAGLSDVIIHKDLAGHDRVITAQS